MAGAIPSVSQVNFNGPLASSGQAYNPGQFLQTPSPVDEATSSQISDATKRVANNSSQLAGMGLLPGIMTHNGVIASSSPTTSSAPASVTSTIDANSLGGAKPFSVPTSQPDNNAQNILGASVAPNIPTDDPNRSAAISKMLGLEGGPDAYNKAQDSINQDVNFGVNDAQTAKNALDAEAMRTGKSFDDQINMILQHNPQGLMGRGFQDTINSLTQQKNSALADIAIRQSVANGNFEQATKLAAQKVAADAEDSQNKINAYKDAIAASDSSPAQKAKMQMIADSYTENLRIKGEETLKDYQLKIDNQDPAKQADLQLKIAQISKTNAEAAKLRSQINDQGDTVASLANSLITGGLAPAELSKRATGAGAYNDVLTAANKMSMATTGKPFNIAKADRDYKYANQTRTQDTLNYFKSLVGTDDGTGKLSGGNLDELQSASNKIDRTDFPALNNAEAWAKLSTGNVDMANFQAVTTEVADQVAKILQGGSTGSGTSDAKLQQASNLFKTGFSKDQITGIISTLKPLLINRAKSVIGDNPYLKDYSNSFGFGAKPASGNNATASGKPFDYAGAIKAGHSDAEIQAYLKAN